MDIIGHRGAAAAAPENTLSAIRTGMECADYVEVDVRLSRDHVPVIMHDPTVDRTTNGSGRVGEFTAADLHLLDAGQGEQIPTLEEVCLLVGKKTGLCVEIKEPGSELEVCEVLDRVAGGPSSWYRSTVPPSRWSMMSCRAFPWGSSIPSHCTRRPGRAMT